MLPGRWTPTRRDWLIFLALAAVMVSFRSFLIITNQWNADFGGDLPEALISGRAAFDVLNGSWRGWQAYLYNTGGHVGNEIAASAFALPLFWLFGPSLLALTAVPTLAAVLTAALVFRLSRSRDAAILATTYLVFMPIAVQRWQIYPYFSHCEAVTWFLIAVWIAEPVSAGESRGAARPFATGLVIGLGIVVCDLVIAAVPAIVFAWWVSKAPRPSRAASMAAALGLAAGVLPYAAYAVIKPSSVSLFYRLLFENGGPATDPLAYVRPFALPASMLWPFASLSSAFPVRLLLGLAGVAGLIVWGRRLTRVRRHSFAELAVLGFIAAFMLINVLTRNIEEYYTYALAAPIAFVAGSVLAEMVGRWESPRPRAAARFAVAATGFLLLTPALFSASLTDIEDGWNATRMARGYSFHSPGPYPVFSGYKTALGRDVERVASQTQFSQPAQSAPPEKIIFIARGLSARHALSVPDDYYIYGADVTSLGVARLAAQAAGDVEPRYWREAFGSIAVFAANDLLLRDLVPIFADGSIERLVPECCLSMFYSELGRKIRDRGARGDRAIEALLTALPPAKRAWVESGAAESQFVDYRISRWPRPRAAPVR